MITKRTFRRNTEGVGWNVQWRDYFLCAWVQGDCHFQFREDHDIGSQFVTGDYRDIINLC